jgi:hypothetical protein
MMTKALKKDKGLDRTNKINLATWNIRGQYTDHRAVSLNVDDEWKELKYTISKVADEV